MLLRILIGAASLLCAPFVAAQTYDGFDGINRVFDLPSAHGVEFDTGRGEVFAFTDGYLLRWDLDPFRLVETRRTGTLAADLAVSPQGYLYAAGLRWDSDGDRLLGGSIVGHEIDPTTDRLEEFIVYQVLQADEAESRQAISGALQVAGIAQFSSIAFDSVGMAYFASPVHFALTIVPEGPLGVSGPVTYRSFSLGCGPSEKISVIEDTAGRRYYISSTTEGAVLELGRFPAKAAKDAGGECFRVANVYAQKRPLPTFNWVRHSVLDLSGRDIARGSGKYLLALEPNNGRLYVFEIDLSDGDILLSRSRSMELDLTEFLPEREKAVTLDLLAASRDGSEILVAAASLPFVMRLTLTDAGPEFLGRIGTGAPVHGIALSDDAQYAAIVTGENAFDAPRNVTIIRQPDTLEGLGAIPKRTAAIAALQRNLNEAGLGAVQVDGIFGPETRTAVEDVLETVSQTGSEGAATRQAAGTSAVSRQAGSESAIRDAPSAILNRSGELASGRIIDAPAAEDLQSTLRAMFPLRFETDPTSGE